MRLIQIIIILTGIILWQSCAQISAPTGGAVDVTPPQLDSAGTFPSNFSTNFMGDKITLSFDEYFVLTNPTANVFFSPSLDKEPEFLTTGKTLTILLNNELKKNTTYTINFGDAISDYTVGNVIPDFKYVFSTGDFLDSMTTSGLVTDAFLGGPKEDVFVMLYDDLTDSVVTKSKPVYYAKTNKEGRFSISYIKTGTYKMFALEDQNRNFKYDLPNEMIGNPDNFLNFQDTNSISGIQIAMYEKDYKGQSVDSKVYSFPGKLTLAFQKPSDTVLVMDKEGKPITFHSLEYSKNRDSLIIWKPEIENKKNELKIRVDTVTKNHNLYGFVKPRKDTALYTESESRAIEKSNPLVIKFARPVSNFNKDLIQILKDSSDVEIDDIKLAQRSVSIYFKKEEGGNYQYLFKPNAFEDIFGFNNNDTISGYTSVTKSDYYGIFTLTIKTTSTSTFLVQFMNDKGDVLKETLTQGNSNISFDKLAPGKYKVKAIKDANKNGKWDTGDYYKKQKPEEVILFKPSIEIRSNWEVAEDWKIE